MKITVAEFLQNMYGNSKRKGLGKMAYEHPIDVVANSYLDCIAEDSRKSRLFKCCLLHDALEDSGYNVEQLFDMLNISVEEMEILKLLSRNIENEDGTGYIEGILNNSDALIVKLADRIANMKDLICWLKSDKCSEDAIRISEKYIKENKSILDGMEGMYPQLFDESLIPDHPFVFQVDELMKLTEELEKLQ